MSQSLITKKLHVEGMTCTGCETRIENALCALPGVVKAKAKASDGSVEIEYNPNTAKPEMFEKAIESQGYKVAANKSRDTAKPGYVKMAGLASVLLLFILLGSRFGWFQALNFFPLAGSDTSLGMLFVIGLLTSVHCVAMCGGINLSQCIGGSGQGRFSGLMPSLKYNLGRVISYTVIGGIVGAIGSTVQFTGAARGILQLAAGVFMVMMGLSLSGMFPFLHRFTPHLPKALGRKIAKQKRESNSPLYVGLLNGLMPCGPLQAMQLYALSSGSAAMGALSMLLFSLGTVPLMFALGALSTLLSRKFTKYMVTAGAVLVVVMGISMFQNGLALSGVSIPSGVAQAKTLKTGSSTKTSLPGQPADTTLKQTDGNASVQEIKSTLSGYGYPAITVTAGIPVKWTIEAPKGSINGCNRSLVIPEYNIQKDLAVGDNVIEFTPTRAGTFSYSCWMGMIRSTITVTQNDTQSVADKSPDSAVSEDSGGNSLSGNDSYPNTQDSTGSGAPLPGGCCGGAAQNNGTQAPVGGCCGGAAQNNGTQAPVGGCCGRP